MEQGFKKGQGRCPLLLDLITNHGDWRGKEKRVEKNGVEVEEEEEEEEEEELELRLGPPGKEEYYWVAERKEKREEPSSLLSPSKFAKSNGLIPCFGSKRGFLPGLQQQQQQQQQQRHERKGSGPPTAHASASASASASGKAAGANNSSQRRTAAAPIVGWPPVRSFRKNLASTSKPCVEPQNRSSENESEKKGLFVKINMDGIPIGRKVDLKAYDSYEKLSRAVDELFRGLLAAQRDPLATGTAQVEEKQVITGLLDGSGEYTLVYEDEEGDRMLVGDVPWNMFVSTVKRLRVLRTSDLSASFLRKVSRKRAANEC